MDRQPRKKSAQLTDLENVFERRTRRFSPFVILGLRDDEGTVQGNAADAATELQPTHTHVDTTPTPDIQTGMGVDTTPMWVYTTPIQVVAKDLDNFTTTNTPMGVDTTPMGVDTTPMQDIQNRSTDAPEARSPEVGVDTTPLVHPLQEQPTQHSSTPQTILRMREVVAAAHFRAQLSKKARDVLSYLNRVRSEDSARTIAVGYGHISGATDVDPHYLRRNVLPKLMMLGLISIVHKTMQGTSYHLHYDAAFMQRIGGEEKTEDAFFSADTSITETFAPDAEEVKTPLLESVALRRARAERDQALQEKELAEETFRIRQDIAKTRFLATLSEAQNQWMKHEVKRRVDADPSARLLQSRYPLYKAEEEKLLVEWMGRSAYGEEVPGVQD